MTRRHAYLIMAHGEYELLGLLVARLDDVRNDIYIHIDRKCERLPELRVEHARLTLIAERHDVRWADVSVLAAEMALFRAAYGDAPKRGGYAYYHLLSGVDLPLKTQDYIHDFCARHEGTEFIGFYSGADLERDLERKVQRRHLFARSFRGSGLVWQAKRVVRALAIRLQEALGMRRYPQQGFAKGTQWLSITEALVSELVAQEAGMLRMYADTFCCDEIAIQTFVASSPFMQGVYDPADEGRSCLRHIGWQGGELIDFEPKDFEALRASDALFARKFNSRDMDFVRRVWALSEPQSQA